MLPKPGASKSSQNLVVKIQNREYSKSTIVVSKQTAKRAVDRNRIKRLIREAQRELKLPQNLVIIVKKNIADLKKDQIKKELQQLIGL